LKFSFKKKIISHENKDIKKLQNENSTGDLSNHKDNKVIEVEKEENEKRENTNHDMNLNSDGKFLESNSNSDKETKLTLQEETEDGKGIDSENEDICNSCKENL
jgi:hypothetical protein